MHRMMVSMMLIGAAAFGPSAAPGDVVRTILPDVSADGGNWHRAYPDKSGGVILLMLFSVCRILMPPSRKKVPLPDKAEPDSLGVKIPPAWMAMQEKSLLLQWVPASPLISKRERSWR